MPEGAHWLLIWEGDKKIYEEEIPDPPVVKIERAETKKDGVLLTWSVKPSLHKKSFWFLVHWFDERRETWRGVEVRQQETSLLIPRSLYVEKPELRVRILATSGIATGEVEGLAKLEDFKSGNMLIALSGIDTSIAQTEGPKSIPNVVSVLVADTAGRQYLSERITWYGNHGVQLVGSRHIDLPQLSRGRHLVRVVVRGLTSRTVTRSWLIERTQTGFLLHNEMSDPKPTNLKEDHQLRGSPTKGR